MKDFLKINKKMKEVKKMENSVKQLLQHVIQINDKVEILGTL